MSTSTLTSREQLEKLSAEFVTFYEDCEKKDGGATADDQAKINKMSAQLKELRRSVATKDARSDYEQVASFLKDLADMPGTKAEKSLEELGRTQMAEAERLPDGRRVNPGGLSLGALFAESAQYKTLDRVRNADGGFAKGATVRTEPFQTGLQVKDFITGKNLITGAGATTGGAFVINDRQPFVVDLQGTRPLRMVDVVRTLTTSSDTVDWVTRTGYNNNAAPVEEADTILDLADYTESTQNLGRKPESDQFFSTASAVVRTIAHWMPITRRALADVPQMRGLIEEFLRYGIAEEFDFQILRGPGTGENFTGILSTAGLDSIGSTGTDIDAVVDAIRFVEWTGRRTPDTLVLHPNDWYSTGFLLAKDTTNQYIVGDPTQSLDQLRSLWGLRVVVTDHMTENFGLVLDSSQAILWQREGVQVFVTDSNRDWFERNILAILAEARAAFALVDPQAAVRITSI